MEYIAPGWLKRPGVALPFPLPLYLRFMLGLSLGVLVVVSGVTTLTRFAQPPSNPFSAYADLLPGQPRSALVLRRFSCSYERETNIESFQSPISQYCVLLPETGAFDHIGVMLSDNVIKRVAFSLGDNSLTVGDLAVWWGRPEIGVSYREWMTVYWPDIGISVKAWAEQGQFSYSLPLRFVTFTEVL